MAESPEIVATSAGGNGGRGGGRNDTSTSSSATSSPQQGSKAATPIVVAVMAVEATEAEDSTAATAAVMRTANPETRPGKILNSPRCGLLFADARFGAAQIPRVPERKEFRCIAQKWQEQMQLKGFSAIPMHDGVLTVSRRIAA